MTTFIGETMKRHRNALKLTQENLADETGFHLKTIQRAESTGKASSKVLHRIATALKVTLEDLKRPYYLKLATTNIETMEKTPDPNLPASFKRASHSIRSGSAEALRRASERYSVSMAAIVDLAPALFTLFAEMSLAKRGKDLGEVGSALDVLEKSSPPHLDNYCGVSEIHLMNAIQAEEESIQELDLRGESSAFSESAASDPFLDSLNSFSTEIPNEILGEFDATWGDRISYRCCEGDDELEIRKAFREKAWPEWAANYVIDRDISQQIVEEALEQDNFVSVFAAILREGFPAEAAAEVLQGMRND
jgi:transcriptional regulator with XRE-family HTH domain